MSLVNKYSNVLKELIKLHGITSRRQYLFQCYPHIYQASQMVSSLQLCMSAVERNAHIWYISIWVEILW